MNESTNCYGSKTCRYSTAPVSPKYCRYSSPSLSMIRGSWAVYWSALWFVAIRCSSYVSLSRRSL